MWLTIYAERHKRVHPRAIVMDMTVNVPSTWVTPLDAWGAWLRAADRPPTTRYLRDYQVRRFASEVGQGPWTVTLDEMVVWIGRQDWAAETKRSYRAALRSFYGWAHITGRITSNPAGLLPPIKAPIRKARPTPEVVLAGAVVEADERVRLMVLLAARGSAPR
jgi:hypothetical protein